jgi:hypothetical protein
MRAVIRFRVRGSGFRVLVLVPVLVLVLVGSLAAPARADWVVAPFLGGQMGGDALHKNTAVGISGGWKGNSWLGAEADFSWAPQFFEQNGFTTERQVTTFMGNVVVSIPSGKRDMFQPYVSGGLGLIRPTLSEPGGVFALTEKNKLGTDIGGGATIFFNRSVGIRGDLRYFHGLHAQDSDANAFNLDLAGFHFWRTSAGLAVRF